jgi:alanyl-tRNA synthetase
MAMIGIVGWRQVDLGPYLLTAALRETLGKHVQKVTYLSEDEKLRFDFTHFEAIPWETLWDIEEKVQSWIFSIRKYRRYNIRSKIHLFKVLNESEVSPGVRRIEAITNKLVWENFKETEKMVERIKSLDKKWRTGDKWEEGIREIMKWKEGEKIQEESQSVKKTLDFS